MPGHALQQQGLISRLLAAAVLALVLLAAAVLVLVLLAAAVLVLVLLAAAVLALVLLAAAVLALVLLAAAVLALVLLAAAVLALVLLAAAVLALVLLAAAVLALVLLALAVLALVLLALPGPVLLAALILLAESSSTSPSTCCSASCSRLLNSLTGPSVLTAALGRLLGSTPCRQPQALPRPCGLTPRSSSTQREHLAGAGQADLDRAADFPRLEGRLRRSGLPVNHGPVGDAEHAAVPRAGQAAVGQLAIGKRACMPDRVSRRLRA